MRPGLSLVHTSSGPELPGSFSWAGTGLWAALGNAGLQTHSFSVGMDALLTYCPKSVTLESPAPGY